MRTYHDSYRNGHSLAHLLNQPQAGSQTAFTHACNQFYPVGTAALRCYRIPHCSGNNLQQHLISPFHRELLIYAC
ncbi:hypothetical protein D3C81_1679330 [compost metagenome]